ncbi:prepilin peptidase [Candidatus Woesearchaeota archaeon]|nr:prepilin peptidase [Candidatus Woesearchaeota archaeon]
MIIEILIIIAVIYLLIGSYTDLKTREVPDIVNFSFIALAFGVNLSLSVIYSDWSFIVSSIIGFFLAIFIAMIMYYTGQWGGGDAKMLFGLGALLGIGIQFPIDFSVSILFTFKTILLQFFNQPPLLFIFFVYMLIVGGVYGILWSIYLAAASWKKFIIAFNERIHQKDILLLRKLLMMFSLVMIVVVFFIDDIAVKLLLISLLLMLILTFYLYQFIKVIEKVAMLKSVNPEQLTEGDWIAEDIVINDIYIAGPKDLGIEKMQILKLIELHKEGKIENVQIKQGIPFIPSFLITLLMSYFVGLGWLAALFR